MKSDVSALVQMFEFGKTFASEKKPTRTRKTKDNDEFDLLAEYLKHQGKADKLKKAIESIEKMNKKEDKKDENSINPAHLAMWMMATLPITGPAFLYYWVAMLASIKGMW